MTNREFMPVPDMGRSGAETAVMARAVVELLADAIVVICAKRTRWLPGSG